MSGPGDRDSGPRLTPRAQLINAYVAAERRRKRRQKIADACVIATLTTLGAAVIWALYLRG